MVVSEGIGKGGSQERRRNPWAITRRVGVAVGAFVAPGLLHPVAPVNAADVQSPPAVIRTLDVINGNGTNSVADVFTITAINDDRLADASVNAVYDPGQQSKIAAAADVVAEGVSRQFRNPGLPGEVEIVDASLVLAKNTDGYSGRIKAAENLYFKNNPRGEFGPDISATETLGVTNKNKVVGEVELESYVGENGRMKSARSAFTSPTMSAIALMDAAKEIFPTRKPGETGMGPVRWTLNGAGTAAEGETVLVIPVTSKLALEEPVTLDLTDKGQLTETIVKEGTVRRVQNDILGILSALSNSQTNANVESSRVL